MPLWLQLALVLCCKCPRCWVLSCKLCQRRRGSPCAFQFWVGWDPAISKIILWKTSCRIQRDGILLGVLPARVWALLKQCVQVLEPRCFPGSHSTRPELLFCAAWVVLGHAVQYSFLCPQYPAAGFDACRVWIQCWYEFLCAFKGMSVIVLQAPEPHHSTTCG